MANLTHLFKVGQEVKVESEEFGEVNFYDGIVKEVYEDHIIVTNLDLGIDGYYEEGFNLEWIYPAYNFTSWEMKKEWRKLQ